MVKKKKKLPVNAGVQKASVQSLGQEDALEESMEETAPVFLPGKCQQKDSLAGYGP